MRLRLRRRRRCMLGAALLLAGVVSAAGCRSKTSRKARDHVSGTPTSPASAATDAPDPASDGLAALPTDLIVTAVEILAYQPTGSSQTDHLRVAEFIATISAQRIAMLAQEGVLQRHLGYVPPPAGLAVDNLYGSYLDALAAYQRTLVGNRAPDPAQVRRLADHLQAPALVAELERRADAAAAAVASTLEGSDQGEQPRIVYLDRGTPLDQRCKQAMREALPATMTDAAAQVLPVTAVEGLELVLGAQARCVAIVNGRLLSQLATTYQWQEALGAAVGPRRNSPPFFDAHLHVLPGAFEQTRRILAATGAAGATVMPLPGGPDAAEAAAATAALLHGAAALDTAVPLAFVDPEQPEILQAFEAALASGARGVKLLSGHGERWNATGRPTLDRRELDGVLQSCAEHKLPVVWHVNAHLLEAGALAVLERHRAVNFILPHFAGYLTFAPGLVRGLLEAHPNLYLDVSLGSQPWYVRRALEDLSLYADEWTALINDYPTRFVFAVDLVIEPAGSVAHAVSQTELHLSMLLAERYLADLVPLPDSTGLRHPGHHPGPLRGLGLRGPVVDRVLRDNARALGLATKHASGARPGDHRPATDHAP